METWPKRDPISSRMIGCACWNGVHEVDQQEMNTGENSTCDCLCHYSEEMLRELVKEEKVYVHRCVQG